LAISANTTVNVTLTAGFVISGKVTDSNGNAVANASVQAYQGGTGATCCTFVGAGSSDSFGNYSFVVPAGTYKVWTNPPTGFLQQWYGGTDFSTATPLAISANTTVNVLLH
jgi:hypothetical protein